MNKVVVSVVTLAALFGIYKYVNKVIDQLKFNVEAFKIDKSKSSIKQIVATLKVAITNPTTQKIALKSIIADILYKGSVITKINNLQNVLIAPKAITSIAIPLIIIPVNLGLSLATAFLSFFQSKMSPVVDIKGTVDTTAGKIPFSTDYIFDFA